MEKRVRINCGKCGTVNTFVISELPLRIDNSEGIPLILCHKCCKEKKWYTQQICDKCSEKTLCKGLFLSNLKEAIKNLEGL